VVKGRWENGWERGVAAGSGGVKEGGWESAFFWPFFTIKSIDSRTFVW
jgi:hypothetical protein